MNGDTGWTLAGLFGSALAGGAFVLWMMSKRTIHIEQHNIQHNEPHVETAQPGGGGIAPTLIGWAFAALVAGIIVMAAISLVQSAITSINQAMSPTVAQPAATALPVATAVPAAPPTSVPVRVPEPIYRPIEIAPQPDAAVNPLWIVVAVLSAVCVGVWGWIALMVITRGKTARSKPARPRPAALTGTDKSVDERLRARDRENRLEAIIPSVVHDLEKM